MTGSVIIIDRYIGPVYIECFLYENHRSDCTITRYPIEDGSSHNDHAYIEPKSLTLEVAGENATDTYNQLVAFQAERVPFDVVTGLAVYPNMLIEGIQADRDKRTAKILHATVSLLEIAIVGTARAAIDVGVVGETGNVGGAADAVTAGRLQGTTQRGDSQAKSVTNQSILSGVFR